jgi:cytosine/adenosine deaminase-related metal-dependent hydrolase
VSGAAHQTLICNLDFAVTVDGADRVVHDAALLLEGRRIAAVGVTADVAATDVASSADVVIDGRGLGATPGFVDTHVHLSETLSRAAFPDTVSTRPWVFSWVMPYYGRLTVEDERVAVTVAAWEMLRSGTTCFLDMGALNDPAVTVRALAEIGIRGVTGRHAADVRPEQIPQGWTPEMVEHHFFPDTDAALGALRETVTTLDGFADGRIRCWVNLQGKELCSPRLFVEARQLAEELGVGSTYHLASTVEEAEGSLRRHGARPVERMAALGALGSNVVLAHAVATSVEEVEMLARTGTRVSFCPGTSMKLAKGAAAVGRYPEMLEAGVVVGLGTDGVSASGNLSLMRQMHLVSGLFKDARMDASLVGAGRALRMATIDGARALGLDAEIGSLETGKQADIVLFDLSHPEWVPYADPVQALVWSATPASIAETWVAGRRLYADGRVQTIPDVRELVADARARSARIGREAGLDRGAVPAPADLYD